MNYVEIMRKIIENGNKEFTHHDIIQWTNTNCPHGVLRQLKKYYEIEFSVETKHIRLWGDEEKTITKRFRKYKIIKRKEICQRT